MRRLRILIIVFFTVVFTVFAITRLREYITSDYSAPVIHAESDSIQVSVNAGDEELLAGMRATDNLDGDVSDTLVVVSKSKFINKGQLRVNYAAFDKNNNVGVAARNLTYTDYHSPRFSLSQPLRFVSGNSSYDYLKFIHADDCLDGDITRQIKVTFGSTESTSNTATRQKLNLQVTNSAGDTALIELWATFEDYTGYSQPSPALSEYIVYTRQGQKPDYSSYLSGVWIAGNVRKFADIGYNPASDVRISDSGVNYSVPGVYAVSFQLSHANSDDSNRIAQGSTTMYVVVAD